MFGQEPLTQYTQESKNGVEMESVCILLFQELGGTLP
jgi:hypothetical protein